MSRRLEIAIFQLSDDFQVRALRHVKGYSSDAKLMAIDSWHPIGNEGVVETLEESWLRHQADRAVLSLDEKRGASLLAGITRAGL